MNTSEKHFVHGDHIGSTTVVTDEASNIVENSSYSPYGLPIESTSIRYGYETKEYDTVLKHTDFNFRTHKPEWAIFTQPDSLIKNVFDPQALNRYSFERNNPFKYIDPSGHNFEYFCPSGTCTEWLPLLAPSIPIVIILSAIPLGIIGGTGLRETVPPEEIPEKFDYAYETTRGGSDTIDHLIKSYEDLQKLKDIIDTTKGDLKKEGDDEKDELDFNVFPFIIYPSLSNLANSGASRTFSYVSPPGKENVKIRSSSGRNRNWDYSTIDGIPYLDESVPVGTDVGGGWVLTKRK